MNPSSLLILSPFGSADPNLVAAAIRAGAIGVLDGFTAADSEIATALSFAPPERFGVVVDADGSLRPTDLPANAGLVVLDACRHVAGWTDRRVFVQVTSLAEALEAEAAGADAVIVKGFEAAGRVGSETTFVLLQRVIGKVSIPVWVQGGIGMYTAAACMAAGAAGVVLDSQLALVREASTPDAIKTAVRAMDGSETAIVDGRRVYNRPGIAGHDTASDAVSLRALPIGSDACFAKPLADAYQTVGGVVRALTTQVNRQLLSASRKNPLAAGNAFAESFGLRYPIAQGPMTRVSDVVPFAAAVATEGALPFLALALMRGPEVRTLLADCAERLEGKAWGVGVLGFVPPALQEEQLEVIREFSPPVALIAGGRPSQAKPLEDAGIRTFLHVPSPGLLDLFLAQGARRFVFEGLECGGHVGPRSSFVLWETQMQRLMAFERPHELSILFAGGIHDALSAAMVAAIAAPLAERGAEVGVLMGTAYIFTKEAVESGAIQPDFQQSALACDTTVLLETSPGHATRCAETDYVAAFRSERERLQEEQLPPDEMWAALEVLNVGRLRIASKGVAREGDSLVHVPAEVQRREGMVMIGEVAALRDQVGTIGELHRDVTEGATALLAREDATTDRRLPASRDIAIVGMAAIMPGAPDLESFWSNIVGGVNSVREVPPERWRPDIYFDADSMNGEKTPSKWGGFLDPVAFDPLKYGIPPLSLAAIEPVQLLALEVSHRALKDAGYLDRDFDREHTSVIFGAEAGTDLAGAYGFRALWRQYVGEMSPELEAALPFMTEDSFPGILANVIAGRVANRLDLGGSNFTVDAACASSLAAIDLACKDLILGTSEMVVCGGADLHNSIVDYLAFSSVHALSPTGQSRTFDASGDGITLGEGVAAVILKRLEDAERDGDRIYAVIKGVGSSSDGRSLGLTAPRPEGEARALERAYEQAGVSPADVGMVEAHGTGTVVGDRTELETLTTVFRRAGAQTASCALGSVKSQIGHTKCAAGLAGLIKASLALHRRVLPPTLNIEAPNPAWSADSPFVLNTTARPWLGSNRKAGVSAFGFGGTNFHVVLSEYAASEAPAGLIKWPSELFLFRGDSLKDATRNVEELRAVLSRGEPWRLRDLALTVSSGDAPARIALVADSLDELGSKLDLAAMGQPQPGIYVEDGSIGTDAKVAFLFPGQGSQRAGMMAELFLAFPELQGLLEQDLEVAGRMFPPPAWSDAERAAQQEALTDTRAAQPALGAAGLAMARLLRRFGVEPDMVAGHSYGELVALTVAGVLPEEALLPLSKARAVSILEATAAGGDPGSMAAVAADAATVGKLIASLQGVVIANENSPVQTVISGETPAVTAAMNAIKSAGIGVVSLPVACAFHSPLTAPASEAFAARLEAVDVLPPAMTVYSNTTAAPYPLAAAAIRTRLAEHIASPVRFAAELEAMYAAGARIFVEAGPGRVLSGLVDKTLGDRPHLTVTCETGTTRGVRQLLEALAQLAVNGANVNLSEQLISRGAAQCDLSAPSRLQPSPTSWWVNGQRAWPIVGEPPANAFKPVLEPIVNPASLHSTHQPADPAQRVVLDYMRTVRESLDTMGRVVAGYLGQPVAPADAEGPRAVPTFEAMQLSPAPVVAPAVAAPAATVPAVVEASAVVPHLSIQDLLLAIVSERTGYPTDMLDVNLDLEADLSIDSIKRIEILGTLTLRLGVSPEQAMTELPENLTRLKTLRAIVEALADWIDSRGLPQLPAATPAGQIIDGSIISSVPSTPAPIAQAEASATTRQSLPAAPQPATKLQSRPVRYLPAWSATAGLLPEEGSLAGLTVALSVAKGKVATKLAAKLTELGARMTDVPAKADVFIELRSLADGWKAAEVPGAFAAVRDALAGTVRTVVVVTPLAGLVYEGRNGHSVPQGAGLAGLLKSYARERPDCDFHIIHLPDALAPAEAADVIAGELAARDEAIEVAYLQGKRFIGRVVRDDLYTGGTARPLLDASSKVLITGGARGISAAVAVALAERFNCHLDLVGRSKPIDRELYAHVDAGAGLATIRQQLIAGGLREPSAIEAAAAAIVADHEIATTLASIRRAGGTAGYYSVDVRDPAAFGALIDRLYERHGRLDGVIHGAGVIEDSLATDKSLDSFSRVFDTKVLSAITLAEKIRDDAAFMVFFSSVSGAFGNRGQTDYAAANEFLDRLARSLNACRSGRMLSINWGPWSGAGMVSPELASEYARRGYSLIDAADGVSSLISELTHGPQDEANVILTATPPSVFAK